MQQPRPGDETSRGPLLVQVHGALVRVGRVGVLLVGPSGIGKSECALDLISRGHRLVADDVVRIERGGDGLVGSAPDVIRHSLEIRGIGLLYVPDLYGKDAVVDRSSLDLVCRLEEWREDADFDRVGLERATERWLGVDVPRLCLPARPAGSMATLVEAAALDHGLRMRGAQTGAERIDERLQRVPRRSPEAS